MTVFLKLLFSLCIFCGGVWLTATLTLNNTSKDTLGSIAGFVLFPATIAGIISVWRYKPNKPIAPDSYKDEDTYKVSNLFTDFLDYYQLLEIDIHFLEEQLKEAYRKQAVKWHPDKNPGVDTTVKMQQINEAYLILKDKSTRKLYELEYLRFQKFHDQKKMPVKFNLGYQIQDETLKIKISKAREEAAKLAKQSMNDMIGLTLASGTAILNEAIVRAIFVAGFFLLISLLTRACN